MRMMMMKGKTKGVFDFLFSLFIYLILYNKENK